MILARLKSFILNKLVDLYEILKTNQQARTYARYRAKFKIPADFRFNGPGILMYGKGQIIVGSNSYMGAESYLATDNGYTIEIGNGCAISHNVKFYTNSYVADQDFSVPERKMKYGSIKIGNNVWIGANVYVGCNVTIGENSIVGANSVVTKDVEANAIYSGIPAKLVRYKKQ
jgi:maltose O-acetyltransferase